MQLGFKTKRIVIILSMMSISIANMVSHTSADELPRVKIVDGTLVTGNGTMLRGTTFFVDLPGVADMRKDEKKYEAYFDSIFKRYDLNCVRIAPWMGVWKYDIANNQQHREEYLYVFDRVIDWCDNNGVYAIVNLHIQYNTKVEIEKAKEFWSVIATRYRDRTHVIYELLNEPEPKSSLEWTAEIYEHVRTLAPDTHQILFSHVAAAQLQLEELRRATQGIEFSNASVGFHCYDNVLSNTTQWDHAQKLRAAGFPVICTEFISLTNNNDMPISYEHLMHCMMRAEQRKIAWISWGPFSQYRNPNKDGWNHYAIRYCQDFPAAMRRFGIDFQNGPQWPEDGLIQLKCVGNQRFLTHPESDAWSPVKTSAAVDDRSNHWFLEQVESNIYRIRSGDENACYLHGKFDDDKTWQPTITAELNQDWTSQKFQLLRTSEDTYQIRCLWGGLYLTASHDQVFTAPVNQTLGQHWQLIRIK